MRHFSGNWTNLERTFMTLIKTSRLKKNHQNRLRNGSATNFLSFRHFRMDYIRKNSQKQPKRANFGGKNQKWVKNVPTVI